MVKVKTLKWRRQRSDYDNLPINSYIAKTKFGTEHRVFKSWWGKKNKWGWVGDNRYHHTRERAQAAVQRQHEKAVIASLEKE